MRGGRRFAGQVALITGASAGLGAALGRALAAEGADLVLLARRLERLEALGAEVRALGRRAVAVACDVSRDGDLEAAVARARAELGRLDVVIANAGFAVRGRFEELSLADYRRQMETNVFGVLRTVAATLPELRRTGGRLAIVGSVAGHVALPGNSAYAMSKHAVRALAGALRSELAASGVSVTHLSPGYVTTEIHQVDNEGVRHPDAADRVPAWLRTTAEDAAARMVAAIHRREAERVITGHGRAMVLLGRLAPGALPAAARAAARLVGRGKTVG